MSCQICPRKCESRSLVAAGFCGATTECRVARISLHPFEEPCISGTRGSGTIFFSGCNLKCVFCQNAAIRDGRIGAVYTCDALSDAMLELQANGAHNVNLVTPTPHLNVLMKALAQAKKNGLHIPIIYNTSAYETPDTINALEGLVDVYLPDLKYYDPRLSSRFSHAEDYFPVAFAAIQRMIDQVGHLSFSSDGMAARGVLIRHLVLPNCVYDTRTILDSIAERFTTHCCLSVMRQYTPPNDCMHPPLDRPITAREYRSVTEYLLKLGFDRVYLQERDAVGLRYTPAFSKDAEINSQEYMS